MCVVGAQRIETRLTNAQGREVILISHEPERLVAVAHAIGSIDLGVTIRSSADTFGEWATGMLIDVLVDLSNSRAGDDAMLLRKLIAAKLLGGDRPTPFERLLRLDARMWKRARLKLRELYVRLIALGGEAKAQIGQQYGAAYPDVIDAYLLGDREPDQSVTALSVQLLTVPSIATALVSTPQPSAPDFFRGMMDILTAFFTDQVLAPGAPGRRLQLPPVRGGSRITAEGPSFKHKRYPTLFGDLQHLIIATGDALTVEHLDAFAEFIGMFSGMNENTRAVGAHVEYESDVWIAAFNVTIQVARTIMVLGDALRKPRLDIGRRDPAKLVQVLDRLLARMARTPFPRRKDAPATGMLVHDISWAGRTQRLVDMDVMRDPVSFHHPLGWLWAELLKDVDQLSPVSLAAHGMADLRTLLIAKDTAPLVIALEQPIQGASAAAAVKVACG